jgi:hypothetical protein
MGGNALKKVETSRIATKEIYQQIIAELAETLSSLPSLGYTFSPEIPEKESFGDVDVLVDTNYDMAKSVESVTSLIIRWFNPLEIANNGHIVSWSYEKDNLYYQVDFILVSNIEMASFYYSYSDFGAILGRITSFSGLSLRDNGIFVKIKVLYLSYKQNQDEELSTDVENIIGTICLSSNPSEICSFLGLNYESWLNGFNSSEEIFQWIKSSSSFKIEYFLSFNGQEAYKRSALRPFYRQFLEFLEVDKMERSSFIDDKKRVLSSIMEALIYFNKKTEFEVIENSYLLEEKRRKKFHSKLFIACGVNQYHLNDIMKAFRKEKGEYFNSWLDNTDKETIQSEISQWLSERTKEDRKHSNKVL